jgi:predicted ATPase/DNA-binding SARP family transcriptional activator/DNA-binding CsgD family transcriptional regulator
VPEITGDGRLHFAVLGSFRVSRDGHEVDLGPRLQRALLAILVLEAGHVVPVDRLIDLLWREEPPAAAIASVQAYISQLRRVLEPGRLARAPARVLVTQDPGYLLRVGDGQVDALRFGALARQAHEDLAGGRPVAAAAGLADALALWRGDPLAEFAGEPWALAAITRLTKAHDLAAEDRVDVTLALGGHAQAAAELEAMVAARPLRERRWGQLILATYRCGRQADALRAYQRCRTVLAGELGLEPGPGLRRLEAAVLAQDASLDWHPAATTTAVPPDAVSGHHEAQPTEPQPIVAPSVPPLVGRDAELAYLRGRLRQAASGDGGAVVLVGEPGAGKTALAEAGARLATAWRITAAWGRCPDAASTPTYWPWSQVLRALPDGRQVRTARQRLDGDVAGEGDDSARQFQAYQAMAAALGEATASAPVLAIVDDLHAADDASLALLKLLAGDLHLMPALFLFTVRDTGHCPALDQALGELLRHPGAEQVPVMAFEPADVAALVERLTAEPPRPGVVAALMDRTGGNPFYTTELIRLISSEHRRQPLTGGDVRSHDVPSGIRDVLLRRVGRLPDDAQSLLMVAAVAGRELEPELLERVTGLDAEHLLLDLEPAIAAGLVTAADGGWGFRFRHPLIHESLYASAGRAERAGLHARVAAALEDISSAGTADVVQLAYHHLSAGPFGDSAKAVKYARQAGARAVRQGAWQDAVRHLEQALAAITPALPDADAIRCDVLVELGHARRSGGLIREAHRAFNESISLADRTGDEDRMLAAAVAFGTPQLWGSREWGETDPRLIALLERQLNRIGGSDPACSVRILATLATELNSDQTALRGWDYANEALDTARRLAQPEELGIAVSAYLLSAEATDHVPQIRAVLDEMLQGSQGDLTPQVQAILLARLLAERIRSGELTRFDTEFAHAWRLAADVLHSPELQIALRMVEACRYFVAGDVERGAGLMESSHEAQLNLSTTWREPGRIVLDSCRMLLTGTLAEHAEQMAMRLDRPDHPSIPHLAAPAAALGFTQHGDLERATQIAGHWFAPPPRSWTWFQPIAYWAQVAAILGIPDPGWLYDQLAPHAGELAIVGMVTDGGGAVDSLLAGLALHLGRLDDAAEHARAGLALETRVGSRIWINRTTDLINRIGAAHGHALSRDQAVPAALDDERTDPAARRTPAVTAAEEAFELSVRELEVARLVADGLSNPAIASALFISVATVKTHVSHILAKLGLDSRVQLASWVAGHDPGPPAPARDVGNIPLPVSSFVGRASELEQTTAVLGESRVVTLTGAGGVGKTRLALQAAAQVAPHFADGAWLAELAPVRDAAGVDDAVAAVFSVTARAGRALVEFLRAKELLLVLDNCEHLLAEAAALAQVLARSCPRLVILATSREGLGIDGERLVPVPPLVVPGADADLDTILNAEAVRLFTERAAAVKPGFAVTKQNVAAVAAVCRRLDGVPLAIELAAARVPAMTPAELARRLARSFAVLAGGRRGAVARHQTLRAAIDWSFQLLTGSEQALLARLSVFAGGATLEAAEAVCGGEGIDPDAVFGLLASLVARSLVVAEEHGRQSRYRLLETIRQYGEEQIGQSGEAERWRARHAGYCGDLLRQVRDQTDEPRDEVFWAVRLSAEQDNLLAAWSWAIGSGNVDAAFSILAGFAPCEIWKTYPLLLPGRLALGLPGAAGHPGFPLALAVTAVFASVRGDVSRAEELCRQAAEANARRDPPDWRVEETICGARENIANTRGAFADAARLAEQAAVIARADGDLADASLELATAAAYHVQAGDTAAAVLLANEALSLARRIGASALVATGLLAVGLAVAGTNPEQARACLRQSRELSTALAYNSLIDHIMATAVAFLIGDRAATLELGRNAIRGLQWGGGLGMGIILHMIADALSETQPDAAAIIHGAADAYAVAPPNPAGPSSPAVTTSPDQELRARGASMDWSQVIAYTLTQTTRALNELQSATQP